MLLVFENMMLKHLGPVILGKIKLVGIVLLFLTPLCCATLEPLGLEQDGGEAFNDGTNVYLDRETETLEESTDETGTDSDMVDTSLPDTDTKSHSDTDEDTDTVLEAGTDQCPDDENKTEPGLCGCGTPEGTCVISCADGEGRRDPVSHLCWQDPRANGTRTWFNASDYCDRLSLGGITTWRLPKADEFAALLGGCDDGWWEKKDGYCNSCEESPACRELFPLDTRSYWAQTGGLLEAWSAAFNNGRIVRIVKTLNRTVRCVSQ